MTNHQVEITLPSAALAHTGDILRLNRLPLGTGCPHWRIDSARGAWVWRQSPSTPLQRARLAHELTILQHLQAFAFAPQLVWHDANHGVLFRFSDGNTPHLEQISGRARQHLLDHVMTWWNVDIELPPYNYRRLTQQYADDARLHGSDPHTIATLVQSVQRAQHWSTDAFRLTHHDLHIGNLLLRGDAWVVLDWEYAGLANPWVDAVMVDRLLQLTKTERYALRAALPDLGWQDPWQAMQQWVKDLETLWWLGRR